MIRIANAAGFWGDQRQAPLRLLEQADVEYLTLEYLAELTLSILAHQKSKDPQAGFATDFSGVVSRLASFLKERPHLKIVTNAGGMNPSGCAAAVARALESAGLGDVKVAAVAGDDLHPRLDELQQAGEAFENLETGEPLRNIGSKVVSANAYLGARGIVDALEQGARIIVTGRVADASLVVGPAVFEHGWAFDDWMRLGRATVAGHLIECGAQVTGGIDSDWNSEIDLANIGYPIAEIDADGNCVISKPEGTGGRVTPGTVAEQLVYEIGDPAHYLTPDVDADFRHVQLEQIGPDRVRVTGGIGNPAPPTFKVSLAYYDGFMASGTIVVCGRNAVEKGRAAIQMIRDRLALDGYHLERYAGEVLGSGDTVGGACGIDAAPWEVVVRIAAQHAEPEPLEALVRHLAPLVTSGPPGVTGYTGSRPRPHRVLAFWPTLVKREFCQPDVQVKSAHAWIEESTS